jgi:hypothetical protein
VTLAEKLIRIKKVGHLTDAEMATAAGVAPATVRFVVRTGEDPRLYRVCERLERFCEINSDVKCRTDLRFV